MNFKIFNYNEVSSTNDLAKDFAVKYPGADAVFVAASQTNGRGRHGRSFFSPRNTGLYMSLLLHPDAEKSDTSVLTCLAAVAVCDAVKEICGIETQIKWVNDIYYKGKKICGILTEGQALPAEGRLSYVIVGIGLNLYTPYSGFPDDIKEKAGALFDAPDPDAGISEIKDKLCASIIESFFRYYDAGDTRGFLSEYKSHSMLVGKYVEILDCSRQFPNGSQETLADGKAKNPVAVVTGIDDECRLLVRFNDGTTAALSGGEVSVAGLNF
jgi:BirA family biotin operon repressor/biotin-[acetyl-CoA-carboxylase] ligase